ncbi:sigma-70 family RNA polymerase sigma factor [Streptomyces sp. WAC06614]|uniref:sigma-70 family RNA polymerase sigma factor n=1 Tax=Streptomyces sp. WAC06614 TaxID=2487416 RepID=UPI000F79C6FB|nr:sigma-70 family RNA polymerase sigma factor [Streptomyces sp. WAC06614]RSS83226.1 sigma-70 family RNA polymerase sigma factor [Streptomyces sp. WAC06614]
MIAAHGTAGSAPFVPAAERHRAQLMKYANRLTHGDRHRAEDIVQETLLRAWRRPPATAAGDDERLLAWLYAVARNLSVDMYRRDRSVPVGALPLQLLNRPTDGDLADQVVTGQLVRTALGRLSDEHREVIVRVHLCDRTGDQAAQEIGVPPGTVKSRTHYALRALRRELAA